jgi:NAD(P)-dependent dehydrogenase (short-subunit alcohol dehydrogenase family)
VEVSALDGKVAIVTGGAQGIGAAIAAGLAAEGAEVVIADLEPPQDGIRADVSSEEDVVRMVSHALERNGRIDILVNNAGLYASLEMRAFTEIPLEEWNRVMEVNVASMFLACRAVVPVMRDQGGGKIVNISSGTPFRGVPFLLHYVTSKGAIVAFTRALAKELGKDGIHVNCVAPGFTMSNGVKSHPEVIEKLRDVSVASRTIQRDQLPEDVVGAVVFLCTPAADFVTGQTMVIDGGQYFH